MARRSENELPSDIDSERTILAVILIDNEYFFDESVDLTCDDFFLDSHKKIYLVMSEILFGMVEGITHVDELILQSELRKRRWLTDIGGATYITGLSEGVPRNLRLAEYVRNIKDKSRLRRLIGIFAAGKTRAEDQSEDAGSILESVQEQLLDQAAEGIDSAVDIGSVTPAIEKRIEEKRIVSSERVALEMTWGVKGLDDWTRGVFAGEFTIISGESSGYKTAFGVQMTLANAREGIPCAWFSMEMPKEKITQRYYAAMSEILTASMMRDPRLMNPHTHIPEMKRVSAELAKLPIKIDDTSPLRIDKLRSRIMMFRRKFGTRLFLIDYAQLIEGMPARSETEQFKKTLYMLRDIPKHEPSIHVVALSQYSKADGFVKRRSSRTKDSLYGGSIMHHAPQNILMISVEDPEKRDRNDLLEVEFRIAKIREGRIGKVNCNLDRDHLRFCYPQPQLRET